MSLVPRVVTQHPIRAALGATSVATAAALAVFVLPLNDPKLPEPACRLPPIAPATPAALVVATTPTPTPTAPPPPVEIRASEVKLVFSTQKATYLKLADVAAADPAGQADDVPARGAIAMPRHGKLRLSRHDFVPAATASVALRDVPAAYAAWSGRAVKIDNSCEARVIGFAIVSRVTGDPGYAGVEAWTAASVLASGRPVLAAQLDHRCDGLLARDAALPDLVLPIKLEDAALARAARAALIASTVARDTQREWDDQRTATRGTPAAWYADDAITTQVVRHPRTGETFVSAHGHAGGGCGDPHANVWGLFRVRDRQLVPVQLRQLGDIEAIHALVDIDDDGDFELLGESWLDSDEILTRASGDPIDQLIVPFHGCPC